MTGDAFARAQQRADLHGLRVEQADLARPWGGFLVLADEDLDAFAAAFFPDHPLPAIGERAAMSPKLLVVAPRRRLSWQYHLRRAEQWSVIEGPVGVACGPHDEQGEPFELATGRHIRHDAGTRHRLIGLDDWGIVAEIWEHTEPSSPSDEDDIVRLQDDFGR